MAQFTLVGATVAILVAVESAGVVESRVTEYIMHQTVARAIDQVQLGMLERVTAEDFAPPFTPERRQELARRLDPHVTRLINRESGVLRIHVFARDGMVIYSDVVAKRGQVTPPESSPLLADALVGKIGTKTSSLSSPENEDLRARYGSALEVYVPLTVGDEIVGAYEIYQDLSLLQPIRSLIWTIVLVGFGIVFVSLFGVARRADGLIRRQQREKDALIRRNEDRFRSLVGNTSDVIAIVNEDGVVRYASPPAERIWGYTPEALEGKTLLEHVHPDDLGAACDLLEQVVDCPRLNVTTEIRFKHASGEWRDFEVIAKNLHDDLSVAGIVLTSHDITERKTFERDLQRLAFHDPLSDLPNRALFLDRLERALARAERYRRSIAVLFLDLDNFKVVNDSLGHEVGDRLLQAIANRLRACVRAEDTAARLGGDEFTIILEETTDEAGAVEVAERISAVMSEPIVLDGREIFPTFSIGIALSTPGRDGPDTLLRNADLAMYRAKAGGKARYQVFDPSMNVTALERLELESDLRHALQNGELRVFYQPIVALETGRISEMEALLRWQHPKRGLVSPDQFIPLAEETGLIVPIGQWVLEESCRRAQAWGASNGDRGPVVISVNLSTRQFLQPDLVEDIARVLWQTRLDPTCLKLEITESVLMRDMEGAINKLWALKQLGVQLAIDDFGTGYSSLSYLKRFPVDTLKIDRSFVSGLGQDSNDTAIVRSVVALAKSLNLAVTGEGIETPEQLGQLQDLGCDRGQGYFLARPLPPEELEKLLAQNGQAVSEGRSGDDRAVA